MAGKVIHLPEGSKVSSYDAQLAERIVIGGKVVKDRNGKVDKNAPKDWIK